MALLQNLYEVLAGAQVEILVFVLAVCAHSVIFGERGIGTAKPETKRGSRPEGAGKRQPQPTLCAALLRLAKQLLKQASDTKSMAKKLEVQLRTAMDGEDRCFALAGMLMTLGRTATGELLQAVRLAMTACDLVPSARVRELLMYGFLGHKMQRDFEEVLSEAEAAGDATPAMKALALKASLAASDLEASLLRLDGLKSVLLAGSGATPSAAPQHLVRRLVQLAARHSALQMLLEKLCACGLYTPSTAEALLLESAQCGDDSSLAEAQRLAEVHGVALTEKAFGVLVRAAVSAEDAQGLVAKAVERKAAGPHLLAAAVDTAFEYMSEALADAALQIPSANLVPEQAACLLRIKAYAAAEPDRAVLDLYERHLRDVDILWDYDATLLVFEAARRCDRPATLEHLFSRPSDRRARLVRKLGGGRRLADATQVFEACAEKTPSLYNALMDACIECQDPQAVDKLFAEATAAKQADVSTYNIMLKRFAHLGDAAGARSTLTAMRAEGLVPNVLTFNEVLDATARTEPEAVWRVMEDIKASGVPVNAATCSMLLKALRRESMAGEVQRVLTFVDSLIDAASDDALLSSVCEACIRCNRLDLLAARLRDSQDVQFNSSQTAWSVIRSYGILRDVNGAWRVWRQLREHKIVSSSRTISFMVEALVQSGDIDAGHALIRQLLGEPEMRPLVNVVVYCSVLKGFSHQNRFDRVWQVEKEMRAEKLQFSVVTYNALIDACVRGGAIWRVEKLLEEMSHEGIEPNVVTCSTVLKGYCSEGNISEALALLEEMKTSPDFRPDEVTYNTLICGCAMRGLYEHGMGVLDEMEEAGMSPTCFTLSAVAKLVTRTRSTEEAITFCEKLSKKHGLKWNVYVYNNLVKGYTFCGNTQKAFEVVQLMLREHVRPDPRTYALLLRHCTSEGALKEAEGLLRAAAGLPGAEPRLLEAARGPALLQPRGELPTDVVTVALEAMAGRSLEGEERSLDLLRELQRVQGPVRVDPRFRRRSRWGKKAGISTP